MCAPSPKVMRVHSLLRGKSVPSSRLLRRVGDILSTAGVQPFASGILIGGPRDVRCSVVVGC